jgi:hypothetical protein
MDLQDLVNQLHAERTRIHSSHSCFGRLDFGIPSHAWPATEGWEASPYERRCSQAYFGGNEITVGEVERQIRSKEGQGHTEETQQPASYDCGIEKATVRPDKGTVGRKEGQDIEKAQRTGEDLI